MSVLYFKSDFTWEEICEKVKNDEVTEVDIRGTKFKRMSKGEWKFRYTVNSDFALDDFDIYCSSCGHLAYVDEGLCSYQLFDYCPYCGALMRNTENIVEGN